MDSDTSSIRCMWIWLIRLKTCSRLILGGLRLEDSIPASHKCQPLILKIAYKTAFLFLDHPRRCRSIPKRLIISKSCRDMEIVLRGQLIDRFRRIKGEYHLSRKVQSLKFSPQLLTLLTHPLIDVLLPFDLFFYTLLNNEFTAGNPTHRSSAQHQVYSMWQVIPPLGSF